MSDPTSPEDLQWRILGVRTTLLQDVYPRLMAAPWTVTMALAFAAYVGASFVFAGLYALQPDGVHGAHDALDLIWFSVQTLSTIGYGGMTPVTPWANALVVLESFAGLAGVAVVTAILYAKFSLPQARVQFSRVLAIHDRLGVPTLHLRILNERTTPILDAHVHVGVLVEEHEDGATFTRLVDVALVRDTIPLFVMAFTAMHTLDDDSPLHLLTSEPERLVFLMVTVRGVDDRTLQPVYARALFRPDQLVFGQGFADMATEGPDGVVEIDAGRLHALEPRPVSGRGAS